MILKKYPMTPIEIGKIIKAAEFELENNACSISRKLYNQIIMYQNTLSDSEDVIISLVQFNQTTTILVQSIGHIGNNLIYFRGTDNYGKPLVLIQHVSQLNFLICTQKMEDKTNEKRKIGFWGDVR